MKETVAYCDLDDKDGRRPGVAVLRIEVDGVSRIVDVCQVHLTLLSRLPTTTAARGRRRTVRRGPAKRAAKALAAPAKAARKAAAKKVAAKKVAAKKTVAKKVVAKKAATKRVAAKAAPARRGRPSKSAIAGRKPGSRRDQQQRISAAREWARAQGRPIAGKGRLPAGLLEEFERSSR